MDRRMVYAEKVVNEYEIWLAKLPKEEGSSVQWGIRPILIVSNNMNNRFAPTVNVYAFTTKLNKKQLPTHVSFESGEFGLKADSTLIVEQPITVSKSNLINKIGYVDDLHKLKEIALAMMVQNPILRMLLNK